MKANGWQGDPIDVVEMPDGIYTTIDNTRVVSAREAGINVEANVHGYNDPLPSEYIDVERHIILATNDKLFVTYSRT